MIAREINVCHDAVKECNLRLTILKLQVLAAYLLCRSKGYYSNHGQIQTVVFRKSKVRGQVSHAFYFYLNAHVFQHSLLLIHKQKITWQMSEFSSSTKLAKQNVTIKSTPTTERSQQCSNCRLALPNSSGYNTAEHSAMCWSTLLRTIRTHMSHFLWTAVLGIMCIEWCPQIIQ